MIDRTSMSLDRLEWKNKHFLLVDSLVLLPFLIAPLILKLPFRLNIFLSWEGAYRLYLGQIPFKDFGIPMGFGYWLVPALFFYIFGPYMLSLIKAQILLNVLTFFSVRGILSKLSVSRPVITLSLLVLTLSYLIFNFWPWYNNSVIVYEIISIYFTVSFFIKEKRFDLNLVGAAFFAFLAFYTKQDAGAIAIVFGFTLLAYKAYNIKSIFPLVYYLIFLLVLAFVAIFPFKDHDFFYWFNYGQFPHNSRISLLKISDYVMYDIGPEKILLILILFIFLFSKESFEKIKKNVHLQVLLFIAITITLQVIVVRNTSPLGNDFTYFYAFIVAFILSLLGYFNEITLNLKRFIPTALLLVIVFSTGYWKYVSAAFNKHGGTGEAIHKEVWSLTKYKTLNHIKVPDQTKEGIKQLEPLFAQKKNLKVLNMSELTFLAYEFGYTPLTQQPLWYHLGVGIFDKEVNELSEKIQNHYYDIVLFEDIPSLNNFYPYRLRDDLNEYYTQKDRFLAPRKLEDSYIEVFVKPGF